MRINAADIAWEIRKELNEFQKEQVGNMRNLIGEVTKETVKQLRTTSPKRKGSYRKHWDSKTETIGHLREKTVIYVKDPDYRLTHLLEKGHAKRGGGRVEGIPHIEPAERKAIESIERKLRNL